jgi:uncharacterized membrane protein YidH (DUF202 family)
MRKFFTLSIFIFSLQCPIEITAAIISKPGLLSVITKCENPEMSPTASLVTMRMKDLEKLTGKKLTLKEKIVFKIYQSKLKKENRKAEKGNYSKRSKTAFILSILSLATLIIIPLSIILAVIGIILASKSLKEDNEDKKARTAMGLSILALGIIVVGLLIYGIFVSDGAFKLFIIN